MAGDWFVGMAEEVKRKANNHLDFNKMRGRDDVDQSDVDDAILGEDMNNDFDLDRGELDLEVKNFHPHKPKPPAALAFNDPKKHPRFPKPKEREYNSDPDAELAIADDFATNAKDAPAVNMNRMIGRNEMKQGDDDKDGDMIKQIVHGEVDIEKAIALDKARSESISRAKDSRLKPIIKNIDFDKQLEKDGLSEQQVKRLINQEIDVENDLYSDGMDEGDGNGKERVKGVLDWNKMKSRGTGEDEERLVATDVHLDGEAEELDLRPTKEHISRYRCYLLYSKTILPIYSFLSSSFSVMQFKACKRRSFLGQTKRKHSSRKLSCGELHHLNQRVWSSGQGSGPG